MLLRQRQRERVRRVRDRQSETQRETERNTETHTHRETGIERDIEIERDKYTELLIYCIYNSSLETYSCVTFAKVVLLVSMTAPCHRDGVKDWRDAWDPANTCQC